MTTRETTRTARELELETRAVVHKQFAVETQPAGDRRVRFIVTTSAPDRENDVVVPSGVDTTNFRRNPIIPFAHDYHSLPVGRAVDIQTFPDRIEVVIEFATADMNPMAEQVYQMILGGFLNACSVGFKPLTWARAVDRDGIDFLSVDLLEVSIVPVPANAQALVAAAHAGVDVSMLRSWARRVLRDDGRPLDGADEDDAIPHWLTEARHILAGGMVGITDSRFAPIAERAIPALDSVIGALAASATAGTGRALRREGRRHNAADVEAIQSIHDASAALGASCRDVDPADDDPDATTTASLRRRRALPVQRRQHTNDDVIVFDASTFEPTESDLIEIDPAELRSVVREMLADLVTTETRAAIDTLRGRVTYEEPGSYRARRY